MAEPAHPHGGQLPRPRDNRRLRVQSGRADGLHALPGAGRDLLRQAAQVGGRDVRALRHHVSGAGEERRAVAAVAVLGFGRRRELSHRQTHPQLPHPQVRHRLQRTRLLAGQTGGHQDGAHALDLPLPEVRGAQRRSSDLISVMFCDIRFNKVIIICLMLCLKSERV